MLETELLVTTTSDIPILEVHRDILKTLEDAFEENLFAEHIPEVVTTSYLGPEPDSLDLVLEAEKGAAESSSSSSNTVAVIVSFVCVMMLLAFAIFPSSIKMNTFNKVVEYYNRRNKCQKALPTSTGPSKHNGGGLVPFDGSNDESEDVDDALMAYSVHSSEEDIGGKYIDDSPVSL